MAVAEILRLRQGKPMHRIALTIGDRQFDLWTSA